MNTQVEERDERKTPMAHTSGVSMQQIAKLGEELLRMNERTRHAAFKGDTKQPPPYNAKELAKYCGLEPDAMLRRLDKNTDPLLADGLTNQSGRTRRFTLAETRAWVKAIRENPRPEDKDGSVICVANFKGGVAKTVGAVTLAQGLSLRGYNVLLIDVDPQGSATSLMGINPYDVEVEHTILPITMLRTDEMARDTLQESIQTTYWDGIDLIAANQYLFTGEFNLPSRQMAAVNGDPAEEGFQFWEVLNRSLSLGLRQQYDFIIIDTPPALSYMTMATIWAADSLLMPLPPEVIDFASSAQFWTMLSGLSDMTEGQISKEFKWLGVVPTKVDHTRSHVTSVLAWMKSAYKDLLMTTHIPYTAAVSSQALKHSTVFDTNAYVGTLKTLQRARDAYESLVQEVEGMTISRVWQNNGGFNGQ